jgi:hypothetical protein
MIHLIVKCIIYIEYLIKVIQFKQTYAIYTNNYYYLKKICPNMHI